MSEMSENLPKFLLFLMAVMAFATLLASPSANPSGVLAQTQGDSASYHTLLGTQSMQIVPSSGMHPTYKLPAAVEVGKRLGIFSPLGGRAETKGI
jgi:hypothetical protein